MNIYEMYGRLSEKKLALDDAYKMTLELLRQLKSGEVDAHTLVVEETGWQIGEPDETA